MKYFKLYKDILYFQIPSVQNSPRPENIPICRNDRPIRQGPDVGASPRTLERPCHPIRRGVGGFLRNGEAENPTGHILRERDDPAATGAGIFPGGILRPEFSGFPAKQGVYLSRQGF